MAIPVIDPTTSVLAFRRGEFFVYQPAATNTPTGWSAEGLPDGVQIDALTGKISGAATEPGFFVVALYATNGTGTSVMFPLKIGIEAIDFNVDAFVELDVEIGTGKVTNPAIADSGKEGVPAVHAKMGDWLLLSIGWHKGGILQPLPMSQVDLALKEFEPDPLLQITDGTFEAVGSFDTQRARIAVKLDPEALRPVLSNYEDDKLTAFDAIAELRWGLQHILPGDVDPSVLEGSSGNFIIRLARDLAPDIGEGDA